MLRTVLAVVLGYVAIVILVMLANLGLFAMFDLGSMSQEIDFATLPLGYLVGSLVVGAVSGIAGGWVAARVATHSPERHGFYLAVVVLALGLLSLAMYWGKQPLWYALLLPVIGFFCVRVGAGLGRGKQAG